MLVANPGQTAAYALHAKSSTSSLCHTTNKNNAANSANNISSSSNSVINSSLGLKTARHVLANNCLSTDTTIATKALPLKLASTSIVDQKSIISKLHTNHPSTTNCNNNQKNTTAISTTNTTTTTTTSNNCSSSDSSNTTSTSNALMKTLSVRLNRGTEFLKETVHKALISKIPSHLSSVLNLNLYTVAPTETHRFPEERVNASSADSLQTEMCHFKPIRTAPTTPWKCSSKSRGASLKMPKACLATKVKLDCYDDVTGEESSLEAEGYLQFRPNPNSTLLTTIFTTPSRQSAFVCLVTQVKLNTSMKIKQSSTSTKQKASKTKKSRSRTKAKKSVDTLKQPNSELLGGKHNLRKRSVRSPFVNVQQRDLASDIASRINLRARTNSTAVGIGVGGAGGNRTRSKSKVKLDESQSPTSNDPLASQRSLRKRKLYTDDTRVSSLRKSPRLSKDCSSKAAMTSKHTISGTGIRSHSYARLARRPSPIMQQQKRPWSQFSPPLTRSRLKQLSEQKLAENPVPKSAV